MRFVAGSTDETPEVSAAKVEAGLLWFMYVSTHKEGYSCKVLAKDCDSAWATTALKKRLTRLVSRAMCARVSVEHHQDTPYHSRDSLLAN